MRKFPYSIGHQLISGFTFSLLAGFTSLLMSPSAAADDNDEPRWFEVEVILFTRDIGNDVIKEEFPQKVKPIRMRRTRDLLTPYHYPDIRPLFKAMGNCSVEEFIATPEPSMPTLDAPSESLLTTDQSIETTDQPIETSEPLSEPRFDPIAFEQLPIVIPDMTQPQAPPPKTDCLGNPIRFDWSDPLAFLTPDKHRDRSFAYHYDSYPRVIDAGEREADPYVHLMARRNFQLGEIYATLRRQPDIRPILHTAWRQTGVSEKRARATRLYGGIDFSEKYDFQGHPITPLSPTKTTDSAPKLAAESEPQPPTQQSINADMVQNIERLLTMVDQGAKINYQTQSIETVDPNPKLDGENPTDLKQVIEVDGLFKIYIDPYNYLHIDAQFNVRREGVTKEQPQQLTLEHLLNTVADPATAEDNSLDVAGNPILYNYYFDQTRRVITKQLHYFDHPHMGMIVQIRRYGW